MSILFLGAAQIPGISKGSIWGVTAFTYVVLGLIPGLSLVSLILSEFTMLKLILLVVLLSVSIFAVVSRVKNRNQELWKSAVPK
jgi:uncharacterized membrane protein